MTSEDDKDFRFCNTQITYKDGSKFTYCGSCGKKCKAGLGYCIEYNILHESGKYKIREDGVKKIALCEECSINAARCLSDIIGGLADGKIAKQITPSKHIMLTCEIGQEAEDG